MPHSYTPYLENPQWDSPKNIESRRQAIILPYREHFGHSVPSEQQYWTMCGAHFDGDGEPIDGEYGQLIQEGVITPNQFHGVDREEAVISKNISLYPDTNWYHGDFCETMRTAIIDDRYNPSVINYDGVMLVKFGVHYLKRIMQLVDHNVSNQLLLVANFVRNNPWRRSEATAVADIIRELNVIYPFPDHWVIQPWCYTYHGSGPRSNTWMSSFVFRKSKHDPQRLRITKGRRLDIPVEGEKSCLTM